jgi:hypothetical protein
MRTHAVVARRCRPRGPLLLLASWLALALWAGCGSSSSSPRADEPDGGSGGGIGSDIDAGQEEPVGLSCEEVSGSRLRKVVRQNGDGTSEFLRLHDTDLGVACSFAPANDGKLRCLPVASGAPVADGEVRYSDKTCTAPIAQLAEAAGAELPTIMRELAPAAEGCADDSVPTFHTLGKQLAIAPETTIFEKVGDTCTAVAAPETSFFAIADELPADTFVSGTESYSETGRIGMAQFEGDDGSRACGVLGPFRDRDLGDGPCQLSLAEDGSLRCLPQDVAPTDAFSDELCAEPVELALVDEACAPDAAYVSDPAGTECPLLRRVRALGKPLESTVYSLETGACAAVESGPVARAIGALVSPFSFAEFKLETGALAGDRLERVDLVSEDGLRLFRSRFVDTELDTACSFRRAGDGSDRCLPLDDLQELTARAETLYSDSACTTAVVAGRRDPSCAGGKPRFILETTGGRTRVYEAGASVRGPLYELDGKTCEELPEGTQLHELGEEILAQRFVGGTEIIE